MNKGIKVPGRTRVPGATVATVGDGEIHIGRRHVRERCFQTGDFSVWVLARGTTVQYRAVSRSRRPFLTFQPVHEKDTYSSHNLANSNTTKPLTTVDSHSTSHQDHSNTRHATSDRSNPRLILFLLDGDHGPPSLIRKSSSCSRDMEPAERHFRPFRWRRTGLWWTWVAGGGAEKSLMMVNS
ncbi:hypothetical protein EJ03DRAFT_114721 [Teratosphaeria nubilosa]|uniref:Uncharacterized protein n=1 Tax=Teratosphaeria nubilosa TaxID=161662 RepID=A0A6G1L951_9PEZI|nr:hypothetical protein EJ03DRAFT_114721 [Teratosphaeria nubilosa]